MGFPSLGRAFLIALAVTGAWRLHHSIWTPLATLLVVAAGCLLEAHCLARFLAATGAERPHDWLADQPDLAALPSSRAARSYPVAVALLALAWWGLSRWLPGTVRLEPLFGLLALCHATPFRTLCLLAWPSAAASVGKAWGRPTSPAELARIVACRTVVLPQQGGLTAGRPSLAGVESFVPELPQNEVLRLSTALLRETAAPTAPVLIEAVQRAQMALPHAAVEALPGLGWRGVIEEHTFHLGGLAMAEHLGHDLADRRDELVRRQVEGGTVWLLMVEETVLGAVLLADPLRPGVDRLATELHDAGVARVGLVTEADPDAAARLQRWLGCDDVAPREGLGERAARVASWSRSGGVIEVVAPGVPRTVPEVDALAVEWPDTGDALALALPWRAARAAIGRDERVTRVLLRLVLVPVVAALAGLPLAVVILLDELLVLGTLSGFPRRAEG